MKGLTMRRLLLVIVVLLLTSPASHARQADPLVGVYVAEGLNPAGNPYKGVVDITAAGKFYRVHWMYPSNDDEETGIGFVSAGVLAVSIHNGDGLAIYKIEADQLTGEWVAAGNAGVYPEVLTRAKDHPAVNEKPKVHGDPKQEKQG